MNTQLSKATDPDLSQWLEGHHQSSTSKTGEVIHVYAIAGPPVFGDAASRWDFDIEVPLWGVTWILKGFIDLTTLDMNATLSVRIPILGTYALSDVKGNLKDGISTTFGISILNGNARFYVSNGKLYVDLSAVVFGTKYGPESIALIPLPI